MQRRPLPPTPALSLALLGILAATAAWAEEAPGIGRLNASLPEELGTLKYERHHDFENPALGVSIAYGAPGHILTVYLYDYGVSGIPDGVDNDLVSEHFEQVKRDVLESDSYQQVVFRGEDVVRMSDAPDAHEAYVAEFRLVAKSGQVLESWLYLTGARGLFLKVRYSFAEGSQLEAIANRKAILEGLEQMLPTIRAAEEGT